MFEPGPTPSGDGALTTMQGASVPIVDLEDPRCAEDIDAAARTSGFFYLTGHQVPSPLTEALEEAARRFFRLPAEEKALIAMWRAGKSWRGWFPEGGEYTSGTPDGKEGIYFGTDLPPDHKSVALGVPLHGPNLYPASVPELATLVSEYMACATRAAQRVLAAISSALCGDTDWLHDNVTSDPTVLFRVFQYPSGEREWGVGEHTDYGLLTLLYQDNSGGLEVHTPTGWIEAPPIAGTLVCNFGDMLERMTGGAYRSTPHRVRATRGGERISFPLFLDPNWHWRPREIPGIQPTPRYRARWDDADPLEWTGTYGEYLTAKVAKVFPKLFADYVSG